MGPSSPIAMPTPTPPAHALAETLLSEWEHRTGFCPTPAHQTARLLTLALLAELCASTLIEQDVNIDADDICTTLATAASFGTATAAASGPGRAAQVVAALQLHHYGPAPASPASTVLLSITAHSEADLEMDELTFIIEFVQNMLEETTEMIFGHGEYDDSTIPELRMSILVGYGAPAPAVFIKPTIIPNAPPDANGRDAAFAEAAHLFVRRQKASSGLIQRELKLGYNRSCRIVQQLEQAGIIGASETGQLATVLIADEAQLTQHLAELPGLH